MVDDNNISTIEFGEGKEIVSIVDYVAQKDSPVDEEFDARRHNIITLNFEDNEATFDCWGGYREPSLEQEPEGTMKMVLGSAIDYINTDSYEDFCSEFGYEPYVQDDVYYTDFDNDEEYEEHDSHNKKAYAAYEASRETLEKLEGIGLTKSDIFDLYDVLSEKENEGTLDEYESDLEDDSESFDESLVKQFISNYKRV